MGGYFSQEEIEVVSTDEKEHEGTPKLPVISRLTSLINDPRSPGNFSRTPILVQNEVTDPRSPGNELVERTPLYAFNSNSIPPPRFFCDNMDDIEDDSTAQIKQPGTPTVGAHFSTQSHLVDPVAEKSVLSSPNVRYKMDNEAYQHSPIPVSEKDEETEQNESGINACFEGSPMVSITLEKLNADECECSSKIKEIGEDYDDIIIGENCSEICTDERVQLVSDEDNRQQPKKNSRFRRRLNASQKVLFQPYNEVQKDKLTKDKEPVKMPLRTYINENVCNIQKSKNLDIEKGISTEKMETTDAISKLPLQELSLHNKENYAM